MSSEPSFERVGGEYPGSADYVIIRVNDIMIRVWVPLGHDASEIDVEYSHGDGWSLMDMKGEMHQ